MMAESFENGDDELVPAKPMDSSQSTIGDDMVSTTTIWTLPPKAFPGRSRVDFCRPIVYASLLTAFSLTTLLVLLIQIRSFLPNKDMPSSPASVPLVNKYTGLNGWWYRPWSNTISCDLVSANASAFEDAFTIDLRSPLRLSFAKAKLIDVVWDLVFGQGGRLLLAWISYDVFMDGLTRLMETSAVSYQLYASIVFETSSLASTWCSLRAVFTARGWRGQAFLAWFGLATLYVLGYPTLMSAATGYLKPSDIRYRVLNDILVPPDSNELTHCLQIHNAPALGLDDGYIVVGPSDEELLEYRRENRFVENLKSNYTFFYLIVVDRGESFIDIFSLVSSKT